MTTLARVKNTHAMNSIKKLLEEAEPNVIDEFQSNFQNSLLEKVDDCVK